MNEEQRIERVMKGFVPTQDVINSIISLNDGLYDRFKMAFCDLMEMRQIVESEVSCGNLKISGYSIFPEYFFAYGRNNGIPTADYETLMALSDETDDYMFPFLSIDERQSGRSYDFELDFLRECDPKLSWNIENLNLPGMENHHIYMFMHHLFQDAMTFCPADIPYLNPEDLQWQITVQYEFFNK